MQKARLLVQNRPTTGPVPSVPSALSPPPHSEMTARLPPPLASPHTRGLRWFGPIKRVRLIHSVSVGVFRKPHPLRDWIPPPTPLSPLWCHSHLTQATPVKSLPPVPRPLSLSRLTRERKRGKPRKGIFSLLVSVGSEDKRSENGFVDRNTEWPFSAGSRLSSRFLTRPQSH